MYLDWEEQINTLSKSNFSNHCRKVIRVCRFPIAAKTKRIHNLGCSTVPPHPGDRDLNSSPGISGLKIQEDGEVTEWKLYLLRVSVMRKTFFFFSQCSGPGLRKLLIWNCIWKTVDCPNWNVLTTKSKIGYFKGEEKKSFKTNFSLHHVSHGFSFLSNKSMYFPLVIQWIFSQNLFGQNYRLVRDLTNEFLMFKGKPPVSFSSDCVRCTNAKQTTAANLRMM